MLRRLTIVGIALLLAGCTAPSTAPVDDEVVPTHGSDPARPIVFAGCDELDYSMPEDASRYDMGGLQPQYMDPGGQFAQLLFTAMRCESVTVGNTTEPDFAAMFAMIPVEPVEGFRISNVAAYVWIGGALSDSQAMLAAFGPRLRNETEKVELDFTAVGSNAEARSSLSVPGQSIEVQAAMVGAAAGGSAGQMAAYIGDSEVGLDLYLITFSAFRTYSNGAAFGTSYYDLLPVSPPAEHSAPYQAYHNLDYDVTFERVAATP